MSPSRQPLGWMAIIIEEREDRLTTRVVYERKGTALAEEERDLGASEVEGHVRRKEGDDAEGHVLRRREEDDVEGHAMHRKEADDVEGHAMHRKEADDVEGHAMHRKEADDVEGHAMHRK